MSKRIHVIALALLVSLSAFAADAQKGKSDPAKESADKAPRLTIVEPVKDFGTVAKGDKLDWSFTVKNTGTSDLQILAARPSCGCTVADFDKLLKPGETGKVTAHVDTTAFTGPIAKTVTVETNDTNNPAAQLTIHAIVKPYVEAYPAGFVRFLLLQGDTESQKVTIYSEEEDPFQIVKIESPQPWIKAEVQPVDPAANVKDIGRPGQTQYLVTVTTGGPDAKIGPIAEKIHLVTNSKHQPDFYVNVAGVIRSPFRVEPGAVNLGEVSPLDSGATRTIIVRSNDLKTPERLVVSKVESSVPTVGATVKQTANKGEYEVTLQVAKTAMPGDVDGNVKIYTNDASNPVVTVPFKGTIKAGAPPVK